jgi:hypothetical protein
MISFLLPAAALGPKSTVEGVEQAVAEILEITGLGRRSVVSVAPASHGGDG